MDWNGIGLELSFNFFDTANKNILKGLEIPIMILLILCGVRATKIFLSWRLATEVDTTEKYCTWTEQNNSSVMEFFC